jgi:prepilin-type N-terminal cleavage/methylation domain-containing protein
MSKRDEKGFSLIEILIVVVVIAIIAAVAVPALKRALVVAENGNVFSAMRTIATSQVNYYSQNSRFARLNELNNAHSGSLGTMSGTDLNRGKFVLSMIPANPTVTELQEGYTIRALRNLSGEDTIYEFSVTQSGEIVQLQP